MQPLYNRYATAVQPLRNRYITVTQPLRNRYVTAIQPQLKPAIVLGRLYNGCRNKDRVLKYNLIDISTSKSILRILSR